MKPNQEGNTKVKLKDYILRLFQGETFELYENDLDKSKNKPPDINEYLQNRLKQQIQWYDKHALSNHRRFHICQLVIIIVSALIPIINVYGIPFTITGNLGNDSIRIWSSILGGTVTILAAFLQLTKAQESWILYRSTAESLKREYHLFSLRADIYANDEKVSADDRNRSFVKNVEAIIAAEGNRFVAGRQQPMESKM